ncbi:hypothetical protein SAMN05216298_4208 [Glycomyces sambucus]|uniref:Outer membrane channel protein CpnT-like N-terminal domain-containing protein n=1 Tax=Glycomyces sambucus TaxID=380244 RepID=A0A1G9KRG6_9ACTN|nr:hypothetical protein [Glycomyces sambucus]SDL52194.1 hypothetical protein SAMN05216298_4208 [Glycomyces sambucus]
MDLPSELIGLLGVLGFTWPESDEESLFALAGEWTGMADKIGPRVEELQEAARLLVEGNRGAEIDAFQTEWEHEESPPANLRDAAEPALVINIGLTIAAALVLALKIQVIVQLVVLTVQIAWAIATAAVTFGASLAQIPVFKKIAGLIIDQLIGMATTKILNG